MKIRRRRYLIDASFQVKIILLFVVVSLLGSIAAAAVFNFFVRQELEGLMWSTHISAQTTGDILRPLFIKINITGFIFVSALLIIIALWMMRKSSGPLYRMSKDIAKAAKGDLTTEIALRGKDDFKDTAECLDSMLKELKERFRIINEKYTKVSEKLGDCDLQGLKKEDLPTLLSRIESVEKELSRLTTAQK
ncbi:MAG: methyl-accepting chemotaxis protein [Nitrospirae bacterium]|nr:methyl-accepting chemotaxis protein [Nitrospirota bacterium]